MKYAKIENNEIQYFKTISEIRKNISIPNSHATQALGSLGYWKVKHDPDPECDPETQRVINGDIVVRNGRPIQTKQIVDK